VRDPWENGRVKILLPLVLLLAACGSSSKPADEPTPTEISPEARWHAEAEEMLSFFSAIVDRACACTTVDCAESVDDEMLAYNQAAIDKPDTFTEEEDERFGASMGFKQRLEPLQLRYLDCLDAHEVPPFSFGVFLLEAIRKTRDAACACTDYACAIGVERGMADWPELPMDARTNEEAMALAKEGGDCMRAIYLRDGSPDAPQALLELQLIQDRTCMCADEVCLHLADEELKAWSTKYREMRPDRDHEARMLAEIQEISACVQRIRGASQSP
jgi:hypothetical protein